MKIILEDGLSLNNCTGIGNYTLMLEEFLQDNGIDFECKRKKFLENINNSTVKRFFYIIWLNTFFVIYLLFQKKPTTLICTNFLLPFVKIPKVKYIPVIHDLCSYAYPECMTKVQIFYSRMAIKTAIKNADVIITVSETIKQEILSRFKYLEENIKIIYNRNPFEFFDEISAENNTKILKKYALTDKKYILSVATLNKRKNLSNLIEGFNEVSTKHSDIKLVLVGGNGNSNIDSTNENVNFTGYIEEMELSVLYRHALCYVIPSLYEGFGIPILEAQVSKTPTICSDIPVFREVANDSVLYCKPDEKGIAGAINTLISDSELREKLINLGTENCKRFSKAIVSEQFIKIL